MCESYIGATEKSVARIRVSQAGQFIRSMFWIGCIGFGGGSALIPVIEKEIADRQGIDEKQNIEQRCGGCKYYTGDLPQGPDIFIWGARSGMMGCMNRR